MNRELRERLSPTRQLYNSISAIALEVRIWAEKVEKKREFPDMSLCGWCGVCSAELWLRLKLVGIQAEIHVSSEFGSHAYLVVDDHIVDVTATQFENNNKKLVVMHVKEAEHLWYYGTNEVFKTATAFRAWQLKHKWPKTQQAYRSIQTLQKQALTA